jgi:SAM-dependent methyltransferase
MGSNEPGIDLQQVKQMQRQIWAAGDFAMCATAAVIVAEELCEAAELLPGERVLDVATGSGNAALAAARRTWGDVVGLDFVPALLEAARARAAAERLEIEWVEGDAEQLPFEDASFDAVLSTFGVMFAPDQRRAAAELLRVCRSGGRIGLACWTPEGCTGQLFRTMGRHVPPPPGVPPPVLWGTEPHLRELFGDGISSLAVKRRELPFRFHSTDHFLEFFRTYFGPVKMAMARLDDAGRAAVEADVREVLARFNRAGERALVAPSEYLEVVATRA